MESSDEVVEEERFGGETGFWLWEGRVEAWRVDERDRTVRKVVNLAMMAVGGDIVMCVMDWWMVKLLLNLAR